MKESFKISEVLGNNGDLEGLFDETLGTARVFAIIAVVLVAIAAVAFAVSLVLELLNKKLPVAQFDLIAAVVLVVGAVVFGVAGFMTDKFMGMTYCIQTFTSVAFFVGLVAGAGAVASAVVLKD